MKAINTVMSVIAGIVVTELGYLGTEMAINDGKAIYNSLKPDKKKHKKKRRRK